MTDAQVGLYRREWGKARAVLRRTLSAKAADEERHAIHIQALGKDKSSLSFNNADLDEVLKLFRSISQPANFVAQVELVDMGATRKRWTIRHLLSALALDEEDAELLITRRQRAGRLLTVSPAAAVTFETIGEADLERVMIDLKKKCRARWPRKVDLLAEVFSHGCDRDAVLCALLDQEALIPLQKVPGLPWLCEWSSFLKPLSLPRFLAHLFSDGLCGPPVALFRVNQGFSPDFRVL
jgi:hypothetical protein